VKRNEKGPKSVKVETSFQNNLKKVTGSMIVQTQTISKLKNYDNISVSQNPKQSAMID
jgi:hypothetical protein